MPTLEQQHSPHIGRSSLSDRELIQEIASYCERVDQMDSAMEVVDALNDAVSERSAVKVLGAIRWPMKFGDWDALVLGETVFVHRDVPGHYWEEYYSLGKRSGDPGAMLARLSLAPYTWTEAARMLEPLAADRWPYELALKHGIRDGFTCPIGSRWIITYWSRKVLTSLLSQRARALLFLGAHFAAIR
jgi:hypothetical protein